MGALGKIAVIGAGSWATALAKLLLNNNDRINWYVRRPERIDDFIKYHRNPVYLSDVTFDTARINFYSDINAAVADADTLVVAVPSPYFKGEAEKINADLSGRNIVSAVKGIVPDDNMIVTDWFKSRFGCKDSNLIVIGGPCHAEEVALDHLSYLTIGCHDTEKAGEFARAIAGIKLKTILSHDVEGIEYGAVLKNVYAIAAGMVNGMKAGDNFKAMLVCNAIREMRRFIDAIAPMERDICRSAYLGDLLVIQPFLAQPQFRGYDRERTQRESRKDGNGDGGRRVLRHSMHLRNQRGNRESRHAYPKMCLPHLI